MLVLVLVAGLGWAGREGTAGCRAQPSAEWGIRAPRGEARRQARPPSPVPRRSLAVGRVTPTNCCKAVILACAPARLHAISERLDPRGPVVLVAPAPPPFRFGGHYWDSFGIASIDTCRHRGLGPVARSVTSRVAAISLLRRLLRSAVT